MARRKLTEEEILLKQQEKEKKQKELETEIVDYREKLKTIIDNLDSKLLNDFLVKKFANGDFKFKAITRYE